MSEEARRTLRYVEPLSDARTMLTDFFSILLEPAKGSTVRPYQRSTAVKMVTNEREATWQSLKR